MGGEDPQSEKDAKETDPALAKPAPASTDQITAVIGQSTRNLKKVSTFRTVVSQPNTRFFATKSEHRS